MNEGITFGSFIRKKRLALEHAISLRKMAQLLDLSPVHMSNIETGRDAAPRNDVLEKLAVQLKLEKQETEHMYDLAAKSKNYTAVPGDLPEYISAHEYARIALRVARDVDATDQEWQDFVERLRKRSQQGG